MNALELHISSVLQLLNHEAEYAVLRNYEQLPHGNHSRDIDIIITSEGLTKVRPMLVRLLQEQEWKLVTYLKSDRLITFVCGRLDEEAGTLLVQWDFFLHTSVYGIKLMDAKEFMIHRKFNGTLYHVDAEDEFLDKYLYNRAVGAPYPKKYAALRQKVETCERVQNKLRTLFGVSSIADCDEASGRHLLLHALSVRLRHPFPCLGAIIFFLFTFIRNYLVSHTGFSVGFTGPDGVGKTTVIESLRHELGPVFQQAHRLYHFRPTLFGNLGDVAQSAGLKKEVDRAYEHPHRGKHTGLFSSLLRLSYYTVDYLWGYWLKVKTQTRITKLVIFDRYYTDIICDSSRSRICLSHKFLYDWGKCWVPGLDYNILLIASPELILQRKSEMSKEEIERVLERIAYLSTKKGYWTIVNNESPLAAVREILRIIFERQHAMNLQRVN